MKYKRNENAIYLRIDKDEELLETIKKVCELENKTGYFQGIGACSKVIVGTYIGEIKDYIDQEITGSIEIVSLMGNTTIDKEGNIIVHSHGVFSYLDENNEIKVIGGHIKKAIISFTGEINLTLTKDKVTKKYNPETGINIWDI